METRKAGLEPVSILGLAGLEPTFDHSKTASKGRDVTSKTASGLEKPRNIAQKRRYREHCIHHIQNKKLTKLLNI